MSEPLARLARGLDDRVELGVVHPQRLVAVPNDSEVVTVHVDDHAHPALLEQHAVRRELSRVHHDGNFAAVEDLGLVGFERVPPGACRRESPTSAPRRARRYVSASPEARAERR